MIPPINADEAKVIQQFIAIEGYQAEVTPVHGYVLGSMKRTLTDIGIDTKGLKTWQIEVKKDPRPSRGGFFACAYDDDGHVLALRGNGPWMRNESLRALKAMPELRSIRWDHNGFVGNHPEVDLYYGAGFDALAESNFSVGEMANGRVTEAALALIARMPRLTRIGFHEAVVSYENGLKFLAPMKGKLKELDLSMSLVSEADLEKLKGDQPNRVQFLFRESLVVVAHRSRSMACH